MHYVSEQNKLCSLSWNCNYMEKYQRSSSKNKTIGLTEGAN